MSCMRDVAAEQRAQLNNVISHHKTSDVANFVTATMTEANRATYLLTASEALSHTYARNAMLVGEARQVKINIDASPHLCVPSNDQSHTANDTEEPTQPLSMAQTLSKILEISREIAKVSDCSKMLTRLIEDEMAANDAVAEPPSRVVNREPTVRTQPGRIGPEADEKACCNIQ